MIERANLLLFRKSDLPAILGSFGWREAQTGKLEKSNGEPVSCWCCEKALTAQTLGNIVPGSQLALCDNPMCFSEYAARNI